MSKVADVEVGQRVMVVVFNRVGRFSNEVSRVIVDYEGIKAVKYNDRLHRVCDWCGGSKVPTVEIDMKHNECLRDYKKEEMEKRRQELTYGRDS